MFEYDTIKNEQQYKINPFKYTIDDITNSDLKVDDLLRDNFSLKFTDDQIKKFNYRKKVNHYKQLKTHLSQYLSTNFDLKSLYWYYLMANEKYENIYRLVLDTVKSNYRLQSDNVVFEIKP